MTNADKVLALTDLLGSVMHTLELKQYEIEDPHESHQCEVEADVYRKRMMEILYGEQ